MKSNEKSSTENAKAGDNSTKINENQDSQKNKGKIHLMIHNEIMAEENDDFDPLSYHLKEL